MRLPQFLKAESVCFNYPDSDHNTLDSVSFTFQRSSITGLVGLSATGKSTLGQLIKGFIEPTQGKFSFGYEDSQLYPATIPERMKYFGWCGTHPENQLFESSVYTDIAFGPKNQGLSGPELDDAVYQAMQLVGLDKELVSRHPLDLSGGQRRRVAIAGIIAMRCPLYIFDEPTAGLDWKGVSSFMSLIKQLRDGGCGILWITHELKWVAKLADEIWLLENGILKTGDDVTRFMDRFITS